MVWGFAPPLGLFARYGRGEFFTGHAGDGATHVRWVYGFRPRALLFRPMLALVVSSAFRPFMHNAIAAIRREAERAAGATPSGAEA